MKKRPIRRTPNITMLDEEYRRSLARAQVMSKGLKDGEELHDQAAKSTRRASSARELEHWFESASSL